MAHSNWCKLLWCPWLVNNFIWRSLLKIKKKLKINKLKDLRERMKTECEGLPRYLQSNSFDWTIVNRTIKCKSIRSDYFVHQQSLSAALVSSERKTTQIPRRNTLWVITSYNGRFVNKTKKWERIRAIILLANNCAWAALTLRDRTDT